MKRWITSLKTKTPQQGFELAILLAQKGIEYTQPDEKIRKRLRPKYSRNAGDLIAASEVIALHFQTVAKANDYWKNSSNFHRYKNQTNTTYRYNP